MKAYKKSALLLGLAMLGGSITAAGEFEELPEPSSLSKEEIAQMLMAAHANFFYRADAREDSAEQDDMRRKWFGALREFHGYVIANAQENDKLLNTAKWVRRVGEELAYRKMDAEDFASLENIKRTLQGTTFQSEWFTSIKPKTDAKEILLAIIDLLQSMMIKQ